MARYVYTVFSNAVAGQEKEYNRWYNEQHLDDVLRVAGFVSAQRFKLAQPDPQAPAQYLAIYNIDSNDVQKTLAQLVELAGKPQMPISPALDMQVVKTFLYEQITDVKHK